MNQLRSGDLLEGIEITDAATEGKAIARYNNLVIFVEGGVPGDVADVLVTRNKKNFAEARIVKMQKASEHRITPVCEPTELSSRGVRPNSPVMRISVRLSSPRW